MTIDGTTIDGNRQDYTPPSDESASVGIEYLVLINAGQEPVEFGLDGNDQIALNEYNPSVDDSDRSGAGGAGNDTLLGNRGNDVVLGQDGNDLLIVNNGDGSDFMEGADDSNDFVFGENGNDLIVHNSGGDVIDFGDVLDRQSTDQSTTSSDDIKSLDLDGGEGNDLLVGSEGDDGIDLWVGGISEAPPAIDTANLIAGGDIIA